MDRGVESSGNAAIEMGIVRIDNNSACVVYASKYEKEYPFLARLVSGGIRCLQFYDGILYFLDPNKGFCSLDVTSNVLKVLLPIDGLNNQDSSCLQGGLIVDDGRVYYVVEAQNFSEGDSGLQLHSITTAGQNASIEAILEDSHYTLEHDGSDGLSFSSSLLADYPFYLRDGCVWWEARWLYGDIRSSEWEYSHDMWTDQLNRLQLDGNQCITLFTTNNAFRNRPGFYSTSNEPPQPFVERFVDMWLPTEGGILICLSEQSYDFLIDERSDDDPVSGTVLYREIETARTTRLILRSDTGRETVLFESDEQYISTFCADDRFVYLATEEYDSESWNGSISRRSVVFEIVMSGGTQKIISGQSSILRIDMTNGKQETILKLSDVLEQNDDDTDLSANNATVAWMQVLGDRLVFMPANKERSIGLQDAGYTYLVASVDLEGNDYRSIRSNLCMESPLKWTGKAEES